MLLVDLGYLLTHVHQGAMEVLILYDELPTFLHILTREEVLQLSLQGVQDS